MSDRPIPRTDPVDPVIPEEVGIDETVLVPLVEETARIKKRVVEMGRIRVSTRTETVEQVLRETSTLR